MAYPHTKQHILMTTSGISATASGDQAKWSPGYMPMIIRAVGFTYTATGNTSSGLTTKFQHLDITSGSTASDIKELSGTSSDARGHTVFTNGLNVEIGPGEEVVFNISGAASGDCNVWPWLYVEPRWEQPANDTEMREVT